jgi:zinc transporter, ZIP family
MSAHLFAFILAASAGMATVLGALIALAGKPSRRLMAAGLAFAAGAMILISLLEIMPEAVAGIGVTFTLIAAAAGAVLVAGMQLGLRRLLPRQGLNSSRLGRTGLIVAAAVALHNLPEGMAPFLAALASPEAGVVIAVAIALHNIPEGVAIAMPLRAAGASRFKALGLAAIAGAAEAAGAGIAWAFAAMLNEAAIAAMLAGVAGMMLWISAAELLPAARRAAGGFVPYVGAATGALVMTLSLILVR